jgi:hypothetical protein
MELVNFFFNYYLVFKKKKKIFLSEGEIDGTAGANVLIPRATIYSGVLKGKSVLEISSGGYHTCLIANDYVTYCFGDNRYNFNFLINNKN